MTRLGGTLLIKKHISSNGLRIVFEPNHTVRSVTIGIWIGTGSRFETKEQNGISHFLEHMFFKGTGTRSAKDIAEAFDSIGGQVNAFTSKEYTCYYAKVLDQHAHHAVDVLADMYFNSSFDETELEKEKGVVLEEIRMYEDTPDDIVHDLLSKASFREHSLGFPILGTEETLAGFSSQSLLDYMDDFYRGDNVVISICGNVDETYIAYVENVFSQLKKGKKKSTIIKPQFYTDQIVRKKEIEQAHICLGFEGLQVANEHIYPLILLNNTLGGSMSSRLFQEVREKRGIAYSVFSYHSAYQDTGMVTIYAGTAEKYLDDLYQIILNTVQDLQETGLTEAELHNGKEQIKGSLMLGLESTNSRMSRNGKNELLLRRHKSLDEIIEEIDRVTLKDVKKTGEQIFTKDFALTLISPSGKLPQGS